MTRVWGSSARAWIRSVSLTSAWLPRLAKSEKPRLCSRDQSRIAVHSAPEWEAQAADQRRAGREGEVEPAPGTDPAQAVRSDQPQRGLGEPRSQLGFPSPALVPRLAEARADHHRGGDAPGDALLERIQHGRRRHSDDGQIDRLRHVEDRGHRRQPLHDRARGVDRDDPTGIAAGPEIRQHAAAHFRGIARSADHGD
jgi:hypothetical protein